MFLAIGDLIQRASRLKTALNMVDSQLERIGT
jgi:hypothetical protein